MADYLADHLEGVVALLIAIGGTIGVFVTQRSSIRSRILTEMVDAGVLRQFLALTERIAALESDLKLTRADLARALEEIKDMKKIETFLEAKVHERDSQIAELKRQLADAHARIAQLEQIIQGSGVDGKPLFGNNR